MSEQELVKSCLYAICNKNGFDAPDQMIQRDYELLSQAIEDRTGILISVSTIKRLLHGEFSRLPQIATLNAISTYLGFKNWQEYKINLQSNIQKDALEMVERGSTESVPVHSASGSPRSPQSSYKWFKIVLPVFGLLLILSFIKYTSRPIFNADKASFSAVKTTAHDIPNTVVFNYDIDSVEADSFFIQQSWDKNRRVRIGKGTHTLTDIYYEPGYHIAKLIANDSIIRTVEIQIPTDRWFFYAYDIKPGNVQQYIKTDTLVRNGYLGFNNTDLKRNQINTTAHPIYFQTFFPSIVDVSSDSFVYKVKVRMKPVEPEQCPYILCEIFGQRGSIYFKTNPKGCASEASVHLGTEHIQGKLTDLTTLCTNVFQWTDFEVRVNKTHLAIYKTNELVFESDHLDAIGQLTGLGFLSNGICEVDFVELNGIGEQTVYQDDFEEKY